MASPEFESFMAPFRNRSTFGATATIEDLRAGLEGLAKTFFSPPEGVAFERHDVGGLPIEWCRPQGADRDSIMLYFHGGGYGIGSLDTHRALVSHLAKAAGVQGLHFEYRLAPEYPFPAAFDDSVAIYRRLLDQGYAPSRIAFAGDSAGGGLALSTLLAVRDEGLPAPACGVCLSALTDLTHSGASVSERAHRDPFVTPQGSHNYALRYLGPDGDPRDPRASPLFGRFDNLPPVLVMVGSEEVLYDDSVRVAEKLKAAGNAGRFEEWPEMTHVWPSFYDQFPEAKDGVARAAAFIRTFIPGREAV